MAAGLLAGAGFHDAQVRPASIASISSTTLEEQTMRTVKRFLARPAAIAAAALALTLAFVVVACTMQSGSPISPSASPGGSLAVQPEFKGVICHATGSGSNPFVGIVVGLGSATPPPFSNNGHLDENGNPTSGHEEDFYLGSSPPNQRGDCPGPTPTPTPTP